MSNPAVQCLHNCMDPIGNQPSILLDQLVIKLPIICLKQQTLKVNLLKTRFVVDCNNKSESYGVVFGGGP